MPSWPNKFCTLNRNTGYTYPSDEAVVYPDLIGGGQLELEFLFAAYPQFPANALIAVSVGIDAVFSQSFLSRSGH